MIQVSRAEVCVIACAELFRDAGEIMVSPMTTVVSDRRATRPADVRTGDPADRRRGPIALRHTGDRRPGRRRGLDAVRTCLRNPVLGSSPRRDGREPDRPVRQPEPVGLRTAAASDPSDVRCPGCARQHHQPRYELLGRQPLQARLLPGSRHRVRDRLGQGRSGQSGLPVRQRLPGGQQPRRVRLRRPRPHHAGTVAAPRSRARRRRGRTRPSRCTASTTPSAPGWPPATS